MTFVRRLRRAAASLRVRLMLLVLLAIAPALMLISYMASEHRKLLVERIEADAGRLARLAVERQRDTVHEARQLLADMAQLPSIRHRDPDGAEQEFVDALRRWPAFDNIGLVDPHGRMIASTLLSNESVMTPDPRLVGRVVATRTFTIGDYNPSNTRESTIECGYPVIGEDAAVQGVLFVSIDLGDLQGFVREARLPANSAVLVFDRNGTIIVRHPERDRWVGRRMPADAIQIARRGESSVSDETGADGVRRTYAYVPLLPGTPEGPYLALGLSRTGVLEQASQVFQHSLFVLAIVALVALLAAWFLGNSLVFGKIRVLAAAARRLSEGDLRARSGGSEEEGEMGDLARSFDDMAASLERRLAERERAEAALAREKEFLRALLDSVDVGIMACDASGRITLVNRAVREMHGDTPSGTPPAQWTEEFDLYATDGHTPLPLEEVPLYRALQGEHLRDAEVVLAPPDRPRRTVLVNGQPLVDPAGARVGAVIAIHDVTQVRKLEEQFLQSQKMEAVGRLAGGVAHDFNNMLTVLFGQAELLQARLGVQVTAPELDEILAATERASHLTRQLLAFGRRQLMQLRVTDLNAIITELGRLLQRLIGEDVRLLVLPAGDLGHVRVDRTQIEQVILNLAVNARDAMPSGGTLTIETTNVTIDGDTNGVPDLKTGRYVMLAVTDTGAGMTPEVKARLFEPFFTTKEPGRGTGLGLATVYGIVKQSGGHVTVYSEVGRGTSFKVMLPRVDAPLEVETVPATPFETLTGTETVLVVEDEDAVRAVARAALESLGYRVIEASDGQQATAVLQRAEPRVDLLVTDIVMPGMNVVELIGRARMLKPGIRVLCISGYAEQAMYHQALFGPGTPFLQKPFTPQRFARKVREVLDAVPAEVPPTTA